MSIRQVGQLTLADALVERRGKSSVTLEQLDRLIDWPAVAALLGGLRGSRYGAPAYPPLALFKGLLLQQWYDLSDPGLEDALADRLSFRRFFGLALDERAPDHTTICRFRALLVAEGLTERLFVEVTRQIDAHGLILRQGTMIDASLIEAQVKRPKKPKDAGPSSDTSDPAPEAEAPERPGSAEPAPSKRARGKRARGEQAPSKLVPSETDPDASWARKGGKLYFGYKAHIGVDLFSGIIRRCRMTTASVADTTPADDLVMGDEAAIYADKAYDTKARRAALKARGIKDRIAHRPNRHHPLSARQEQRNAGIGRRRSGVERSFATMKIKMGCRRVRYRGLARNAGHLDLMCTAMNLGRLVKVLGA